MSLRPRGSRAVKIMALAATSVLIPPWAVGAQSSTAAPTGLAPYENSSLTAAGRPREVHFRTDEGTWMSLDVSPDGKTIVFDLLGDLYTIPITGGQASALTSGPEWDEQPRFSPDGRYVAFISDRTGVGNIWVVDRQGAEARQVSSLRAPLTTGRDIAEPTWSPDGRTIVAPQRFGGKISAGNLRRYLWLLAAYDVGSGKLRWVSDTSSRARRALDPEFAPDGKTLYAAVEAEGASSLAWHGMWTWHVEHINPVSGAVSPEMLPSVGRAGMRPAVSRDGRFLAYASVSGTRLGIRLRDLRTLSERWLVPEQLDLPDIRGRGGNDNGGLTPGYAFTPDSKALIVAFGGKIHRIDVTTNRVQVVPFVVDVKRQLAPMQVHQFTLPHSVDSARGIMQPALSPDGRTVAFSALNQIWMMDLPDSGGPPASPQRLTTDSAGEFYPSWSPDGQWIVYSRWRDGEGGAVCRVRARPAHSDPLTACERLTRDTALYFNTAVTPDGQRVVVVRAEPPPEKVVLTHNSNDPAASLTLVSLPLAGGALTTVTSLFVCPATNLETDRSMNRSPTEQLYFLGRSDSVYIGLSAYPLDGADPKATLSVADLDTDVRELNDITGVLSPDGQRALLTHNWELFEVTLPTVDGRRVTDTRVTDAMDLDSAQNRSLHDSRGAAEHWGRALAPWISWSRNGRRALFVQGGTFFVGDVRGAQWISFRAVSVPLLVPMDAPHGMLILRGARLLTMRGAIGSRPEVISPGDIVIRNNRIQALGPTGSFPLPQGATVLDMSGKTILPGYADIHDHFRMPYGLHPGQSWTLLVRLASGITTLRDPYETQSFFSDVFAYRDRERSGDLIGPRIFGTGIAHLEVGAWRPITGPAEADAVVRPTAEYFQAETFKEYSVVSWREKALIAVAASKAGLNATIHGDHLRAVVDGYTGIEHAMLVPLHDDVVRLIALSGITITNTLGISVNGFGYLFGVGNDPWASPRMWKFAPPSAISSWKKWWGVIHAWAFAARPEWEHIQPLLANAAKIAARGGRVAIGSHGEVPGLGIHYEMWLHALGGMPNYEVLRSGTIVGATAIGHAHDFGSLEPGKLADLQILDKNPIEDIRNTTSIRYVMKNGRLYDADDLTQIWPDHKPLPSIYLREKPANTVSARPAAGPN
jgi:Tol biopolymer transport system component/imidazolonepropionase-like amidohydrolase